MIVGVDGPAVPVPGRVAAALLDPVRRLRADLEVDDPAQEVLADLDRLGRAWRSRQAARTDVGTLDVPMSADRFQSVDGSGKVAEMTVAEFAAATGVSPRAVRARAARGSLPARQTSAGWLIDTAALDLETTA